MLLRIALLVLLLSSPAFADGVLIIASVVVGPVVTPILGLWRANTLRTSGQRWCARVLTVPAALLGFSLSFSVLWDQVCEPRYGHYYLLGIYAGGLLLGTVPSLMLGLSPKVRRRPELEDESHF